MSAAQQLLLDVDTTSTQHRVASVDVAQNLSHVNMMNRPPGMSLQDVALRGTHWFSWKGAKWVPFPELLRVVSEGNPDWLDLKSKAEKSDANCTTAEQGYHGALFGFEWRPDYVWAPFSELQHVDTEMTKSHKLSE